MSQCIGIFLFFGGSESASFDFGGSCITFANFFAIFEVAIFAFCTFLGPPGHPYPFLQDPSHSTHELVLVSKYWLALHKGSQ